MLNLTALGPSPWHAGTSFADEGSVDSFGCYFEVFIADADDDVQLGGALVDHLNIDAFVSQSGAKLAGSATC